MTTHKAHVNILHNQCLALQAIGVFMNIYAERCACDLSWDYVSAIADWTYLRAARHVLPALFDGMPEDPYPCFNAGHAVRLPRISEIWEDDTL